MLLVLLFLIQPPVTFFLFKLTFVFRNQVAFLKPSALQLLLPCCLFSSISSYVKGCSQDIKTQKETPLPFAAAQRRDQMKSYAIKNL